MTNSILQVDNLLHHHFLHFCLLSILSNFPLSVFSSVLDFASKLTQRRPLCPMLPTLLLFIFFGFLVFGFFNFFSKIVLFLNTKSRLWNFFPSWKIFATKMFLLSRVRLSVEKLQKKKGRFCIYNTFPCWCIISTIWRWYLLPSAFLFINSNEILLLFPLALILVNSQYIYIYIHLSNAWFWVFIVKCF